MNIYPTPNHDKAQRCNWSKDPGAIHPVSNLSLDQIHWDKDYQRQKLNENVVLNIAREFSWSKFGVLTVMNRDGIFYVVDGRHRWQAALRRGDIKEVPCTIIPSLGQHEEAETFYGMNNNRTPVSALDKYRAMITAKNPDYLACEEMLQRHEIKVSAASDQPSKVNFSKCIITTFCANRHACEEAIRLQRIMIGKDSSLNEMIHKGLFRLLTAPSNELNGDLGKYAEPIYRRGGKTEIVASINAMVAKLSRAGKTPLVCALGIVDLANRSLRGGRKLHFVPRSQGE